MRGFSLLVYCAAACRGAMHPPSLCRVCNTTLAAFSTIFEGGSERLSRVFSFDSCDLCLMSDSSEEEEEEDRCVACRLGNDLHEMLACDSCDAGWHLCAAISTSSPMLPMPLTCALCAQSLSAAATDGHTARRMVLPVVHGAAQAASPVGGGASRQAGGRVLGRRRQVVRRRGALNDSTSKRSAH